MVCLGSCQVREGYNQKLGRNKGTKVQMIYRPGTEFVEDINSSVAFVAWSFTLESGEMAFREELCASL